MDPTFPLQELREGRLVSAFSPLADARDRQRFRYMCLMNIFNIFIH